MTTEESVDVVAVVEAELAADSNLPEALKAAILERARTVRVRRGPILEGCNRKA